jgi:GNAT superfamily N-acetyltransferase
MIRLEVADPSDARILTSIQAEAFDHEADLFRMEKNRGPEGYDSVEATREEISSGGLYKILRGEEIIGGLIISIKGDGRARLHRIFIDPDHQDKGYGSTSFSLIEKMFPEVCLWELDTPSWAVRNQRFYEKIGFIHEGHTLEPSSGSILYIYRMHGAGVR